MDLKLLCCGIRRLIGMSALCLTVGAGAQESLDRGKSPAQLFASDCSICHKSPRGLTKSGRLLGLESFLREHYTASRESAVAIASYLKSVDSGPAAPARATKRAAKGDEKTKSDDKKKTGAKPGEAEAVEKPGAASGDPKSAEPKSIEPKSMAPKASETKPAEIMAPEPKSVESKSVTPTAGEAKPADAKSEKSE
jgi:hypothetical protein